MNPNTLTPAGLASVLATGQRPSRLQRLGRYTPESMRHPGKMLPAIAAIVIDAFTQPGDLVIDPMCGIGTTLVEAIHLGRDAAGMEYEPDFVHLTLGNLQHARARGATGRYQLVRADARNIAALYRDLRGKAALVLTSPPYGSHTHGHVRSGRDNGGGKVAKRRRDGGLVNRASFFQMLETRRARDRGIPACATAHEDLLVFQRAADLPEASR